MVFQHQILTDDHVVDKSGTISYKQKLDFMSRSIIEDQQRSHYSANLYSHNDPTAFAYFQQELMSPRLQQAFINQSMMNRNDNMHLQLQHQHQHQHQQLQPHIFVHQQQQHQQQQLLQQQLQQQRQQPQYIPSIMVPPQSPTLSSYYFENGWTNHYYDPKHRQFLSSRVDPDYEQQQQQTFYPRSNKRPYSSLMSGHQNDSSNLLSEEQHHLHNQPIINTTNPYLSAAAAAAVNAAATITSSTMASSISLPQQQPLLHCSINATSNPEEWRENLLQFAHTVYTTSPQNSYLLSLLHSLHNAFPTHLPTILLLACVYYSRKDYHASLKYNHLILKYDPNYVEAMSNIGTTLRSLGKTAEAEKWWIQAVKLRPNYWDAVENLIGVICAKPSNNANNGSNHHQSAGKNKEHARAPSESRCKEALAVCDFVEKFYYDKPPSVYKIPTTLPLHQLPRLQNLLYAKGNLKNALGDIHGAQKEYEKGIELAFGGVDLLSIFKLIVYACCHGTTSSLSATTFVKLEESKSIPLILLQPEQAVHLLSTIFPSTGGILPTLSRLNTTSNSITTNSTDHATTIMQTNQNTSNLLLTLAKLFQDIMNPSTATLIAAAAASSSAKTTPTLSTLIPLYYLSLALNPSPSTANNLGIILSNIPAAVAASALRLSDGQQQKEPITGTMLAMQYYMYGLQLDTRHPHLYTNLGSLLKDMGHLDEAISMYQKAVEFNPNFDIALANLGNAIKDQGNVQDSIQWYRRAVEVNPDFVDAVCGLVNSLSGVCEWRGRGSVGNEAGVDDFGHYVPPPGNKSAKSGWIGHVVDIVDKQLNEGAHWGIGILKMSFDQHKTVGDMLVERMLFSTRSNRLELWKSRLSYYNDRGHHNSVEKDEGGWLIRLIERIMRRLQQKWFVEAYGSTVKTDEATFSTKQQRIVVTPQLSKKYARPLIPNALAIPPVPTVLPFHTFTYPLSARQIRLVSHRNALRISHNALSSAWLSPHVYPPPPPPAPRLKIGYVSSDFNNHPLAHLMQSVFGFHTREQYEIYCYAITPSDNSPYRLKIERESEHFLDVSSWSNQQIIEKVVADGIHILVNLNGYTKGARNEIFAARPCPVQCSFMGFAGTLGGGWCDWIVADPIVCPPEMVSCEVWRKRGRPTGPNGAFEGDIDPEEATNDFVYTEKFIYMPHSYFVNDHKQGFRDDDDEGGGAPQQQLLKRDVDTVWAMEEEKRWKMRREVFPHLPDDVVIFANFNQLYKLEPGTFRMWLRILERVPNSILWLLRFPAAGEQHLKRYAQEWAGPQVAQRVIFTDVAPKHIHIHRGRVADIFLDTPECNAHTTAADILWSGTPIITYPKYLHKMCSRVGASIAMATGFGEDMVVLSEHDYEEKTVMLASSLYYTYEATHLGTVARRGHGKLMELRKKLFLTRENSRLFDTFRWTKNLERGFAEAWRRWVTAEEFEDVSTKQEKSGCIWIVDPDDHQPLSSISSQLVSLS